MFAVSNARATPVKAPVALNRPARVLKASRQVKMRCEAGARVEMLYFTLVRLTTSLAVYFHSTAYFKSFYVLQRRS